MALINKVLPGYVAMLYMQTGATPTPLTDAFLSTWTAQVAGIVGTNSGGTGVNGVQVPVESVPSFGADDAFASYTIAGQRTGAKITTQNQPTSMTVMAPFNSADTAQLLVRADGYSGQIIRTYVVAMYDGTNTVAYAFNARIGGMKWNTPPNAEQQFEFVIHPVGGSSYGWSNNA